MARDRLLKQALRERFLVTLTTGEAFDGLLDEHDGNLLVLVAATVITEINGAVNRVKVDGRVYLPRERVAYMQRMAS